MKKYCSIIIMLLLSIRIGAYDFCEGGIYFKILSVTEKTVEVTYKDNVLVGSYSGSVIIPETVVHDEETYTVTSIGYSAFRFCERVTEISIPNTVTYIKQYAFSNSSINSITIPNSVVSIGKNAFDACYSLNQLTIDDGNEMLEFEKGENSYYYEFESCPLNTIYIGRNITYSSNSPFYRMGSINAIMIGNCVTEINKNLFIGCEKVENIIIPNSVKSIGERSFCDCSGLTFVTIGNSVITIGKEAFYGCGELTDVYCYAEKVPQTQTATFNAANIQNAILHVLAVSLNDYKMVQPWMNFKEIVAIKEDKQGDVNGDGMVDATDIVELVNYIRGNLSGVSDSKATDVNGDGVVNIADVVKLVTIIMSE